MQYKIPDSFLIGVESIDAEHQTILSEIGDIKQSFQSGGSDNLHLSLSRIGRMLKEHFRNEEIFMQKIGYPEAEAHAKEHEELLHRIEEGRRMKSPDIGKELRSLLDVVFRDMGKSDLYLREFLESGEA